MASTDSIEARADLTVDAACEIETLVVDILERIANNPRDGELSLRGACMRIRELSRVTITALSEGGSAMDVLRGRVNSAA